MKKQMKKPTVKSDMLKQPSIVNLFICALRKLLDKETRNKRFQCPNRIGQYVLVSEINKSNNYNNYGIAIYSDREGKKVFVKTWQGKRKDFSYYSLINEYIVSKAIHTKLKLITLKNGTKFKTPKILSYVETKRSFSIIYEYVDGKTLSSYPLQKQAEVISEAILIFNKITKLLTEKEKRQLKKRSLKFYLYSLPVVSLLAIMLNKKHYKAVVKGFISCLTHPLSLESDLTFAHHDLTPENIKISKSDTYLFDFEHAILTIPDYDINYLSLDTRLKSLVNLIYKNTKAKPNTFLQTYIAIRCSDDYEPDTGRNYYLNYLNKLF